MACEFAHPFYLLDIHVFFSVLYLQSRSALSSWLDAIPAIMNTNSDVLSTMSPFSTDLDLIDPAVMPLSVNERIEMKSNGEVIEGVHHCESPPANYRL